MGLRGPQKGSVRVGGRQKGTPNKTTAVLKDAILMAAEAAGGDGGLVATKNPPSFMVLLGKVLPMQMTGPEDGPVTLEALILASLKKE